VTKYSFLQYEIKAVNKYHASGVNFIKLYFSSSQTMRLKNLAFAPGKFFWGSLIFAGKTITNICGLGLTHKMVHLKVVNLDRFQPYLQSIILA